MPARDGARPPSPRMHPIVRVSARGGAHGSRIDSRNVGRRTAAQPDRPTAQRQPALGVARRRADLLLRAGPEADARRRQDRPLERHDLGAHRARVHARLRHHRADQLRPRRGLHDRLVRVGVDLGHARRDGGDRADPHRGGHHHRVGHRDAVQRDAQHDDRASRVPAAAHRPQAGAADHRDRHELHPPERRPAVAADARRGARPHRLPGGLLLHLRRADRALGRLRGDRHRAAARGARLVRRVDALRQGDARDRAGPGCGAPHGHRRRPHDLPDVHARRPARRRGRDDLRALQRHDPVQPGLHRRPHRVHRRRHGRHRQPQGRGRRRADHRRDPVDLRHALRPGVDPRRGVRDPDPGDGVQAAGPVRRGDEGRMTTATATLRSNASGLRRLLPNWAWGLIFIGLAILYPYILDQLFVSPDDVLDASIQPLAYIIMALGLNIVVGFAGLLDLGYVAFYAIGAFVIGWLGSQQFPDVNGGKGIHILTPVKSAFGSDLPGLHINFFLVIFIAAGFTAIWGVILGAPTLRLRGDYLAIVTLAFGEIVPRVFENSTSGIFGIGHTDFSNGRQGITPIDKINLPWTTSTFNSLELKPFYYVALGMVLLVIFFNVRVRDSRLGRAWIAVREDEVAAAAMGVNLVRTKLWAYALGAALGGFAGTFLGRFTNPVN